MERWVEIDAATIKALAKRLTDPSPVSSGGPSEGTDIDSVMISEKGFLFIHSRDTAEADFWPKEDLMEIYG